MITNRPPSCDLPPEFYQTKLKECFACCSTSIDNKFSRFYVCSECGAEAHKADWNSIPRRSEVMELLNKLEFAMLASDWNRQDELEDLQRCADKLRKETGL